MRYASIGFHILMVLLLVLAFTGAFSPPRTGSMMQDNGATIMPAIGIITLWLVGAIVLRVVRRFSKS
jgi:hypothetical protein